MTMSKEAVQHIQESANIPAVIAGVESAKTQVPVAVIPQSMCIHSLEDYMPNASRYRLKYTTNSLADFITYGNEYDIEGATCFIDSNNMSSQCIFDLGTVNAPGHQHHSAKLNLMASMSAMERIEAKNQSLIPAEISFTCEPYLGLKPFTFTIRVGIDTSEDRPLIAFRILRLEAIEEEIAEEFKAILVKAFEGTLINTFIGNVK
jgi:uncharacterized protein YfdQ (DUF2303 family)